MAYLHAAASPMRPLAKKKLILSRSISSLLVLSAFTIPQAAVKATSDTWDGSTDGVWATNTNWLTNPAIVPGTGDTATFNGAGNGFTTINLGAGVTINSILFNTASAAGYTIGSGAVGSQTLTLDNAGSITVNSTVTNSELVNANLVLGNDGSAQTFNLLNQSTTGGQLLTIAGSITGSTGAGLKTLAIGGAGNTLISGVIGNDTTGTVALTKSDAGALTLSGVNTSTGGTTLNAGTLNVNNAAALGNTATGALIITGGTLDNTSGGAITTTAAKAMNWNGDFTFTGTNNLSTNLGAVTIGGAAGTRTVTVTNGVLTTGLWTAGAGIGLTKAGAGTLFMANTANTSNIAGTLDIQAGKVQVAGDFTMGGLTGSGTIENGGAASKWLFVNNAADNTFSGTIQGNPSVAAARLGLVKRGVGTLNLTGSNNTYADNFAIENGTVRITGINNVGGTALGQVNVGNIANQNGVLFVDGGTLNASKTNAPSLSIGTVANARGFARMSSGAINTTSEMWVGSATGGYGAFTMSGGAVSVGNWLAVGRNGNGIMNISGGTLNVTAQNFTNGSFSGAFGVTNLTGGSVNVTGVATNQGGFLVAEAGAAVLNVSGTAELNISGARGLHLGINGGTGIVNLRGGTVTTPLVQKGTSTGILNFHGGTLRPTVANATFITGLTNAYVYSGGGTIDTNGNDITIAQSLLAPTGNGVNSVAVATGGAGYIDTPLVTLSGGTGTGATAIANVSGGGVTGFTITNPGVDYLPGDVLTATLFGGGATTPATAGAITLAANTGGGLTKGGVGTLTLSSANTYSGTTAVNAGTLLLDATGSINGSSGITINGTGAKLVQTSFDAISPAVTLTNGTLDGAGTVNSVTVGDGTGGIITHGNGSTAALTIGSLTFNGAATLNLITGATTPELLKTTTLITGATNATGLVTINATNTNSIWNNGVYNLIRYTTLGGQGFGNFVKGTIAGLGARQNATLTNPAGFVALAIGGDLPVWTGLQNGNWTTSVIASPKNWKLQTAGTPTDFISGDTVIFNDTATGTTSLNISDANVSPTSATFDNSSRNYTISSAGGFGIASGFVVKNGTGSVTIGTANTYAGGTALNTGTLNINHASALGTGAVTITSGTIDNTSGVAITLTTNNAQSWNGDFTFGGTNDLNLGVGPVTLSANRLLTTNGTAALTVGGVIAGSAFGLTKDGTGTLVLAGANTYTGATTVSAGRLRLSGTINAANTPNIGQVTVGDIGFDNAVLEISGGTINATKTAAPSFLVGNIPGGNGTVRLTSGTINTTSEMWVGSATGAYGAFTMSGGAVSVGNWLAVGRNGNGIMNISGGTLNVTAQNFTNGSFSGAFGVTNLTGGSVNVTSVAANQGGFLVAEAGAGVLNVSGTAALNISGARGLHLGINGGTGIVNLRGGTVTTPLVQKGTSTGILNFHGGTLRPTVANATFITGLTNAYVYSGGGTIDTNGNDITIPQPLLAPSGSGVSAAGLTVSGSGFIDTPLIVITGGGGIGATAIANIDGSGNLTGITITNPGTDYTSDPITFEVIGGGGIGTITGTPTLVANTSGGLTKTGAGTLTLNGANTYGGTTNVNVGTLRVSNTTGSATGTGPVNVNAGGTLVGTGAVSGSLNIAAGGTLSPGDGGLGTITVGGLTLNSGSILTYEWDAAQNNDRVTVTGNNGLTINGGKFNLYNSGGTTVFSLNGVYNLIGFTGNISGSPSNLSVDAASMVAGKNYIFGASSGFVTLLISAIGVTPNFWNVNADGLWTTGSNWTLNAPPNAPQAFANFGGGGTPITAPRTVTLNANQTVGAIGFNSPQPFTIAGANTLTLDNGSDVATITVTGGSHTLGVAMNAVSSGVQFNVTNSADVLTVSGPLAGTTNVTKIGLGAVTFSAANTYAGTTTINLGTLTISGSGTLGNTANPLSINNGTLNLGGTTRSFGSATLTGGSIINGTLTPSSFTYNGTTPATVSAGIAGSTSVTKNGTGALTLSGNNTYTGGTALNGGTLAITTNGALGADSSPIAFNAGGFIVEGTGATNLGNRPLTGFPAFINVTDAGHTFSIAQGFNAAVAFVKRGLGTLVLSGTNNFAAPGAPMAVNAGTLNITGGITSDTAPGNAPIQIANEADASATLTVSGTATLNSGTSEIFVGQGFATANGVLNLQDSGTINVNNWLAVGRSNGVGTVNMSGGTLNKLGGNGNHVTIGANTAASTGTFNQSGGVINSADSDFFVGESGIGTYDVSGTAQANLLVLRLAVNASGSGTVNLNGGTINASQVVAGGGPGTFNFNGGTLRPVAASGDFIGATVATNVLAGGAIIDTNGVDATINVGLTSGPAPDGGLRKRGAGTLTLTATNTYTGPTVVEAGTLAVSGDISGSTSITVKQGATLDVNPLGMSLASGQTLRGSGTVAGTMRMTGGSKLAPGEGAGTLAFSGDLSIALAVALPASAALEFELGSTSDKVLLTLGTLTIGTGVLGFNDFTLSNSGGLAIGTYTLFDTSAVLNGSLDATNSSGAIGGGFTGTLGVADGGRDIVLTVVPEPGSATMLLCGLSSLLGLQRFRRRSI